MTQHEIETDARMAATFLKTLVESGIGETVAAQLTTSYVSSVVSMRTYQATQQLSTIQPRKGPHS